MLGYSFNQSLSNSKEFFEEHREFIRYLPEIEQNIIEYYFNGITQRDIALMLGITQGAVSSRLNRSRKRLTFLSVFKKVDYENIFKNLKRNLVNKLEIDIVRTLAATTCQSETARILNEKYHLKNDDKMTQVKVRYRFEKLLERLKCLSLQDKTCESYYKNLLLIKNGSYLLNEVKLPHFERRS